MGLHTIARGNCRSINNAIAGNMTSEVRGREEVKAAVAKELNATSNGMPFHSVVLNALKHSWSKKRKKQPSNVL